MIVSQRRTTLRKRVQGAEQHCRSERCERQSERIIQADFAEGHVPQYSIQGVETFSFLALL
jgi:hypothetical protein